jgi:hypothetical protein
LSFHEAKTYRPRNRLSVVVITRTNS